jgi:hypothetical protein
MRFEGVTSVGLGRDERGNDAIVVGLRECDAPEVPKIPAEIDGVPVTVRRTGELSADD